MADVNQTYDQQVTELLKALGRAYLENGEHQKAADKFRQLVNNGIEDAEILLNFALALAHSGSKNEEALQIYKRVVEANDGDESLYLTLAKLFLKENVTVEPALKVYRRSLKFSPPFENQIRNALEKIFQETTDTFTVAELRQTLLDCSDNPELLSVYLATAWRDGKFKDALVILKDLYKHASHNRVYLQAICQTLLEQKAVAEENDVKITIAPADAQLCLKYKSLDDPITRIRDIELYLDFKNLFLSVKPHSRKRNAPQDEYEFIILEKTPEKRVELGGDDNAGAEMGASFDLVRDFIMRLNADAQTKHPRPELLNRIQSIAIFEITNYDAEPGNSKLPFTTFLKLISTELSRSDALILCSTENGIIALSRHPHNLITAAVAALQKVERYNQVVHQSEIIRLRITMHASASPFQNQEHHGIKEIRKAFKIHNIPVNTDAEWSQVLNEANLLLATDAAASLIPEYRMDKLGEFRLPHFPNQHKVFSVLFKETANQPNIVIPKKFGKYEVAEAIKENQLYSTFRGYDPHLERSVVIKAYKAQAFADFKEFTSLRKQFYEEVRKLNRINHPNIGVIYDAGEEGEILYLVRECIDGKILNDYLLQSGLPDIKTTLAFYLQVCKILIVFHQSQTWHKNLKPDNVFITNQNEIKLVDGGLLQMRHTDKIWNADINSQAYSAPEQIQGQRLTQSCDNFQLGVMLYESLTGVHPFRGKDAAEVRIKILANDPLPASTFRADIPAALDAILEKSLAKNPHQRYESIPAFSADLSKLAANEKETTAKRLLQILK